MIPRDVTPWASVHVASTSSLLIVSLPMCTKYSGEIIEDTSLILSGLSRLEERNKSALVWWTAWHRPSLCCKKYVLVFKKIVICVTTQSRTRDIKVKTIVFPCGWGCWQLMVLKVPFTKNEVLKMIVRRRRPVNCPMTMSLMVTWFLCQIG